MIIFTPNTINILIMVKLNLGNKIYLLISIFFFGYICGFFILNLNFYRNPLDPFYSLEFTIEKNPSEKYLSFIKDSKIAYIYEDTFQILIKQIKDNKIQNLNSFNVEDLSNTRLLVSFNVDKDVTITNVEEYADSIIIQLHQYSNDALILLANKIINLLEFKFSEEMKMLEQVFADKNKLSETNELIYINRKLDIINHYAAQRSEYDYLIFNLNALSNFNIYLNGYQFNESKLNFLLPILYSIILTILSLLYFIFTKRIELKIEYKN